MWIIDFFQREVSCQSLFYSTVRIWKGLKYTNTSKLFAMAISDLTNKKKVCSPGRYLISSFECQCQTPFPSYSTKVARMFLWNQEGKKSKSSLECGFKFLFQIRQPKRKIKDLWSWFCIPHIISKMLAMYQLIDLEQMWALWGLKC